MMAVAVDFYKELFRREDRKNVKLAENFWGAEEMLTMEDNEGLRAPFSEEEIKVAVFESYAEGASGPDGLPFLFYQKFWT